MGICKCERRKLTSLFCYQHRVIVCEFCLVASHQKCIIKPYLRWLKDSNFDPCCCICREDLDQDDSKECVRLVCLDVFHWDCLNSYVSQLPPTTTPAGYLCPLCSMPIIPQENQGGPVAETLRSFISKANWARPDILDSQSFMSSPEAKVAKSPGNLIHKSVHSPITPNDGKLLDPRLDLAARQFLAGEDLPDLFKSKRTEVAHSTGNVPHNSQGSEPVASNQLHYQRKELQNYCQQSFSSMDTIIRPLEDEDKYKRRTAFQWLSRLLRNPTHKSGLLYFRNRRVLLCLALVLAALFLVVSVYRTRQSDITGNPLLDIHMNPNIRLDENAAKAILKQEADDGPFIEALNKA